MTRLTRVRPMVGGALAAGAVAAAVAGCGGSAKTVTTTVVQPSASSLPTSLTNSSRGLTINQIYKQAGPGVVDITVSSQQSGGFFGGTQQTQGEGAGVVYDHKADILTDQHVVEGATSVTVRLDDQSETNNATPAGQGSSSGVGFAIPSNMVARIANEIIAGHPVKHAFVGVFLNASSTGGAQISSVQPNTPASRAGLKLGDVVTAINGKTIGSTQQFIETVDTYSPGQTITLTVKRGGSTTKVKLTLGTRPQSQPSG